MVLPFVINGAIAVIPDVYSNFLVQDSLPTPVPAGRSVLLIGEAEEGIPSAQLDLQLNFFNDYPTVLNYYKSGPIVDAARMLFSTQPSPVFGGSILNLYVWKTNQTTAASRALSPSTYGNLVASEYGESGNYIKAQVVTAQTESLPSVTFNYLPSTAAQSLKVSVNGTVLSVATIPAMSFPTTGTPNDANTKLNAVAGISSTGGTARTEMSGGTMNLTLTSAAGQLTLTKSGGSGSWNATSMQPGDTVVIPPGGLLSGASNANAACYTLVSVTSTTLVLQRVKALGVSGEVAPVAFDLTPVTGAAQNVDIAAWAPLTVSVTSEEVAGAGASLEIASASDAPWAAGSLYQPQDLLSILSPAGAALGSISVSVPATDQMQISLSSAGWSKIPNPGDVVWILEGSPIAGAARQNVGAHIVLSANPTQINTVSANSLPTVAVATVALASNQNPLMLQPGFVSTSAAGLTTNSSAENQVSVMATRTSDGTQFPSTPIGGRVGLEMSYWDGVSTSATVSINANQIMTITFGGGSAPAPISVNLNKYPTLQDLVLYLDTLPGLSAQVPDLTLQVLPATSLDMVTSMPIMSIGPSEAYNGRIKLDYYDWTQFFLNNTGLLSFQAGTMNLLVGLPSPDSSATYLSGGVVGASSNADFQAGLDAGLKIDVRMVVPAVSRDARLDIEDGLTDAGSSYTISSVNAAVKSHVATASSTLVRRERFGMISFMGAYSDTVQAAAEQGYERTQMAFQMARVTDSTGSLTWFQPWMLSCALAAGRAQAAAATPMLRKPFQVSDVKHIGNLSVYSDTLARDWDPESQSDLTSAISAGLLCWRNVSGVGVRLESPDLTTRSRMNDPQGWVYERANVLFGADEVVSTLRSVLENVIGNNTAQVGASTIRKLCEDTLNSFVRQGSVLSFSVDSIVSVGNGYNVQVSCVFPEALEFIGLTVVAQRAVS